MSLIKHIDDFAKAVGKEIRETNKRVEELAIRVLITLKNDKPFVIGGQQLILLDSDLNPHAITSSQSPATDKERYRGGFELDHIYFYNGDKVKPFASFKRKELYSRHPKVDFKFSSNCGITLTPNKPVYLVCGWDEETKQYYLAKKWWTQELPEEEDGLIYKHIGFARLNSFIQFFNDGKTYQFKGGAVLSGDSAGNIVIVDKEVTEESENPVTSSAVSAVVQKVNQNVEAVQTKTEELHVKTEEIQTQTVELQTTTVELQNKTDEIQTVLDTLTDFDPSDYLKYFNEIYPETIESENGDDSQNRNP